MRHVIHYCGHRIGPDGADARFPSGAEARVAARIRDLVAECEVEAAHGSLASGADILVAEAVLAAGGRLHVVLPFEAARFCAVSVASLDDRQADAAWIARFERALAGAAGVHVIAPAPEPDAAFAACSAAAMRAAILEAGRLGLPAVQIAVWDGQARAGIAGTAADVAGWQAMGRRTLPPIDPGS